MRNSLVLLVTVSLFACGPRGEKQMVENTGYAQGSTYHIKYMSRSGTDYGEDFSNIFREIDASMSTYDTTSMITEVNRSGEWVEVDRYFLDVLNRSIEIAEETGGNFDPTVGPLVRMWGFNYEEIRQDVTDEMIADTKAKTGYENIEIEGERVRLPEMFSIDFNAIAQGYTVDVIAEFLEVKGVKDYMVEVGGEVRTSGKNASGNIWTIGVDKPQENIDEQQRFQFIISLEDRSLATSGNYRRFWVDEESGVKYSHTINPKTGRPAKNRLLSASITASNAMDADAYATVCMVVGLEECKALLELKKDLEGYLVYSDEAGEWATFITPGLEEMIR